MASILSRSIAFPLWSSGQLESSPHLSVEGTFLDYSGVIMPSATGYHYYWLNCNEEQRRVSEWRALSRARQTRGRSSLVLAAEPLDCGWANGERYRARGRREGGAALFWLRAFRVGSL